MIVILHYCPDCRTQYGLGRVVVSFGGVSLLRSMPYEIVLLSFSGWKASVRIVSPRVESLRLTTSVGSYYLQHDPLDVFAANVE